MARRNAQISCASLVLDRSSTLLATCTKTLACYPGLSSARDNQYAVFCQMRRALDLIHFIVKEAVVEVSLKICAGMGAGPGGGSVGGASVVGDYLDREDREGEEEDTQTDHRGADRQEGQPQHQADALADSTVLKGEDEDLNGSTFVQDCTKSQNT